jgi:mono/diheme cytochrome c family protein
MADQPRYEPLEESPFFSDGRSSRPLPAGVVARGFLQQANGEAGATYPMPVTVEVMKRGQERYNIFCAPCHDYIGSGNGMAVRRGFRRRPPSFHIDRLREAAPGHFYDVIANGFGAMNDYAMQIAPPDRWAIVAYIRALQLSQNAGGQDLGESERRRLEGAAR